MVEINGINVVSEGCDPHSVTQANQSEARLRYNVTATLAMRSVQ